MEMTYKNIKIACDLCTSWMCGNAYHSVVLFDTNNNKTIYENHIHGCENGYEAILYALQQADLSSALYEQVCEFVCSQYED